MPASRRLLFLAAGGAALLAGACLEPAPDWQGSIDGVHVGAAGDSQLHAAETGGGLDPNDTDQFLTDVFLAKGYRASIAATIGASTRDLAAWAGWPEPGAPVGVIVLGANDMHVDAETDLPAVPIAEAEANLRGFIAREGIVCPVLVEIPEESTIWGHDIWGPQWNNVLHVIASDEGGGVVEWADAVKVNPGYLGSDRVHQTREGQAAFRTAIADGVDTFCAQAAG